PELVTQSAQLSLKALGVGTAKHIQNHFTRGRYPGLDGVLEALVADGRVHPIQIGEDGEVWPDQWYIHTDDLPLLAQVAHGDWQPTIRLLSPFDNLICDRQRAEQLFGFHYRSEIYTPKAKRRYGYYVMPILHGDRLIGRIDPKIDRKKKRLHVHAVHVEPGVAMNDGNGRALAAAVGELAQFLAAKTIAYGKNIPSGWQTCLK
ncbi:MAG: DNA glycosylase AlkZ-like family protein, partial [Anaerolineae bacterium]